MFVISPAAQADTDTPDFGNDGFLAAVGGTIHGNTTVFVCDDRADADSAYIAYTAGGKGGRLTDGNGANNGCVSATPGGTVSQYKICIDVAVASDVCSNLITHP